MNKKEKKLLEFQIRKSLLQEIFDKTDALTPSQLKTRNEEDEKLIITLRDGRETSIFAITQLITAIIQNYPSIFPNDNRFFKNMFRLHPKLMGLDYNKYTKPRLAGKLLKHLTYDMFGVEFAIDVLPSLIEFAMSEGIWRTKCYKHLTPAGIKRLIKFRDQANELMDKYEDGQWYEFNAEFCKEYKGQQRLFK